MPKSPSPDSAMPSSAVSLGRDRPEPSQPPGQAEVEDLHQPFVADHHVLGLEVAVHDPGVVGGRHPRGDLAG